MLKKLDDRVKKSSLWESDSFKNKYGDFVKEWSAPKDCLVMDGAEFLKDAERNGTWKMFSVKMSNDPYTSATAEFHGPRVEISEQDGNRFIALSQWKDK